MNRKDLQNRIELLNKQLALMQYEETISLKACPKKNSKLGKTVFWMT
jgi:hypothetical protein